MNIEHDGSKRRFLKTAAYVAPVIMTLNVTPSLAHVGSYSKCNKDIDKGPDDSLHGLKLKDKYSMLDDDFGRTLGKPQNWKQNSFDLFSDYDRRKKR